VPDGTAFQFDENSPHYADARRWAHANGFSQNQFSEMLSFYASELPTIRVGEAATHPRNIATGAGFPDVLRRR
jgi:hypothetical protein